MAERRRPQKVKAFLEMILKFKNLFYDFQENQRCHEQFVDLARFIVFIKLLRVFGSLSLIHHWT